jgi:hypothetical protein
MKGGAETVGLDAHWMFFVSFFTAKCSQLLKGVPPAISELIS